jgi:uncharacterized protein YndB with AHSA1/START domain
VKHKNITTITVKAIVEKPIEEVWDCWTKPEHIICWNYASDEWCCPKAVNNLSIGASFSYRMEAKDGSMGFDFYGVYNNVKEFKEIEYVLGDGRKVVNVFNCYNNTVEITVSFEAESDNSFALQKQGWQSILDNFKKYVEISK